jgi:hypothetical protein
MDANLEQEQVDLLSDLVEASRLFPRDQRQEFTTMNTLPGRVVVRHIGLGRDDYEAHQQDLELLHEAGLIVLRRASSSVQRFYIHPNGFAAYERLKKQSGSPAERIEAATRKHLEGTEFRRQYPAAYEKWELAEGLLWGDDSTKQLSTVGHHCREAIQFFATALVERHRLPEVDPDPQKTVARLRTVLRAAPSVGETERLFVEALIAYWGALSDLVQRQEHAGQKEGRPVTWEDARRLVFNAMVLMVEVDRSLALVPRRKE